MLLTLCFRGAMKRIENDLLTIVSARAEIAGPVTGKENKDAPGKLDIGKSVFMLSSLTYCRKGRLKRLSKSWRQEFFCDENLRQTLRRVVEHKQFVLDRIEHWTKELATRTAGPADKDADALADEEQEKEDEKYEEEEEEKEEI
ncbi:hypothetical protein M441DRAFT_50535 [Trichoderma asperellum CBS 433.97]|uniref:Uncharacterized protein n=1 Tax=Trichoderma asperellum (strain ATCC 204424 / CBS 433.97 / NBRC 101777) TaxID=1042311 RepID=A0A2T3YXK3_TRIA4|nr:hypothetical protein M441DRAFT_50535 [Trichoderma asperellum CBS 433.97]PTB37260.1 hypothetical protein M441DRAFT_50535 [Trichoderma asperellum CBS 433.97]